MSAPIPRITANPNTTVELEDSCNCCWGRSVKKKPPINRSNAKIDVLDKHLNNTPRDADEVYNLHISMDYTSKRVSNE